MKSDVHWTKVTTEESTVFQASSCADETNRSSLCLQFFSILSLKGTQACTLLFDRTPIIITGTMHGGIKEENPTTLFLSGQLQKYFKCVCHIKRCVYQGERKYLIILFTEENMWNDRVMKSSCTHPFTYVFNTYLFFDNFFLKSTQLTTVKILKYGCLSFPCGVDKPWKRLTMDNCDVFFFFLKGKQNTEGALEGRVFWSRKRKLVRESVSRW